MDYWQFVIKPLLSNRFGILNKNEIVNIIKAIAKCENDLFDDECNYMQFYTAFAVLCADKLSSCTTQSKLLCPTQVPQIHDACHILIRFLLDRLSKVSVYDVKWMLPALKSLCEGKSQVQQKNSLASLVSTATATGVAATLLQFDYNVVAALLKSSKYPEANKSMVSSSSSSSNNEKESPKSEVKRSRSDLSSILLQQLSAPLEAGKINWAPLSEESSDCTDILAASNIAYMKSLDGADTMLDVCLMLPTLTRYRNRLQETIAAVATKALYLPLTQSEATQIKSALAHIAIDVSIVWQALALPIYEPLSPSRITKLSKIAISALYCAVLTSIATSVLNMSSSSTVQKTQQQQSTSGGAASGTQCAKELDESEENARFIVDKALEIYGLIGSMLKTSARAHIYQNHLCFGAWLLISGIQGALGASGTVSSGSGCGVGGTTAVGVSKSSSTPAATSEERAAGKTYATRGTESHAATPSARVNLFKVQQGFGVLNAAIANHCIKLLTELIDDLKIESTCNDVGVNAAQNLPEPADFDILENYTSLQRIMRVLYTTTLHQLFTILGTVTYRKACALKRANAKDRTECDPISYSDSTTYFNDTLSCSDNSEEDDSESYLGHWFKETLSPETNDDATQVPQMQDRLNDVQKSNLILAIDEPHEYLELAAQLFCFMDQFFANKHAYLNRYVKSGLSDQQMLLLANILKDLDRDAARGDTEVSTCPKWQAAMLRFSGGVSRYLHNLIASALLSDALQSSLLQYLSVSPWTTELGSWPLQVYPSTLSVLVQIILLKSTQEKEAACLSVWHRFISTLVEGICATSPLTNNATGSDAEYEDLNVEHAQLLLFLFHSLNLMQKKSILLLTAGGVIHSAEICRNNLSQRPVRLSQIMLLSRLLLFLEYLMKHLYNAPLELLDQVRWNLFSISTMPENQKIADLLNFKTRLSSFCHKDIEEKFRKCSSDYTANVRPTFYSLTVVDGQSQLPQEFKLDGLAWNFILCTPDKLKYPLLVDALVDILSITDMALLKSETPMLCAIQYCFGICWKLLLGLPPSTLHVEALMGDNSPNLHSLLWSIRCPMQTSHYLIVNSLIKQGMYTQSAETLWGNVSDRVSDILFSLKQTRLGLQQLNAMLSTDNPQLSHIVLLDALVSHMQVVAWADREGIKPQRAPTTNNTETGGAANTITNDASPDATSYAATDEEQKMKADEMTPPAGQAERLQSSKALLQCLVECFGKVLAIVSDKMAQQLTDTNVSQPVLKLIVPIVSMKNELADEVNTTFLEELSAQQKELVTVEWAKCVEVSDNMLNDPHYTVEEYTLTVVDAHISELTRDSGDGGSGSGSGKYTPLHSLKQSLVSMLNLINLLLEHCCSRASDNGYDKDMEMCRHQLQDLLVAAMMDIRFEYMYDVSERCIQTLIGGGDSSIALQQLYVHEYTLRHCYQLLLVLPTEQRNDNVRGEAMAYSVLSALNHMVETSFGVRAMHRFFCKYAGGSLTELLLSFTGTAMSATYSRKMLQFFERLFQFAEQPDSPFPLADLVSCFDGLAQVDTARLRLWFAHIIHGPARSETDVDAMAGERVLVAGSVQPSSTPSSNAQTPTNMATASAMPSLSEQLAQSSSAGALDEDAMEVDEDVAIGAAAGANNTIRPPMAPSVLMQSLSLWQQATNQSDASTQEEHGNGGSGSAERNGSLLLSVVRYIVADGRSPGVAAALFQALLQLGQSLLGPPHESSTTNTDFSDILQVMITLADTAQGRGHATLFGAAIVWLEFTKYQVLERALNAKHLAALLPPAALENITALLRYLVELLQSLGYRGSKQLSPPWDDELQAELAELLDDMGGLAVTAVANGEEDDSLVEDSDEDSLNNKLCTFSQTQKEFMNQHWYHCHTCNMVNTVGVCSVCARVCHRGHDVSYAKYGNFFCDCGAKEDGSCQALSRRVSSGGGGCAGQADYSHNLAMTASAATVGATSSATSLSGAGSKRRAQTPPATTVANGSEAVGNSNIGNIGVNCDRISVLAKLLADQREPLLNTEQWTVIVRGILDFFDVLMPLIREHCATYSIVGCHGRARSSLERLHSTEQTFELSEQLLVPTLGSQEGAFENVRMNYSGDQGQTIKQLLSSGLVRRVALCCLCVPHGRRQHLAVSHEKGKVTILQLSALLRQADAAKRKLTLTQLASAPVPCTVLSLAANAANEDCLAVCGLKECHVLTFASTGATSGHIVLTPQLENGNFIKRALWLPGSMTMLALVTADYVKVYDLAVDAHQPRHHFLVAVGKIRDCTFVYQDDGAYYLLLIASSGYIYYQKLDDLSLAKHGDFYVTNTLELSHTHIKDVNGQVGGGGVSIYYSHALQLLFFSYSAGRSFMAPLSDVARGVRFVTQLQTAPVAKNSSKGPAQPLCQWTEIVGHPGLVCAMAHTSNNPVIFMLTPDRVLVQEIKAQSSKARIMDMVAIRHTVAGVEKTTLILLCEDGSLRIFTAQPELTGYWLSPHVQPHTNQLYTATRATAGGCAGAGAGAGAGVKKTKRKAAASANNQVKTVGGSVAGGSVANGTAPIFPIDFFEHCTLLADVEFGGNDLLQIYNKQKLKTRLFSTGMFVASTRPSGFTLEVHNHDASAAIVGIRVLLGTQDPLRAPQTVTVVGRTIATPVRRARWFDIPLTRDEILQSDKCLRVMFGRSQDPEHVSMLDSIEVYGKAKDLVGWPDDNDAELPPVQATAAATNGNGSSNGNGGNGATNNISTNAAAISALYEAGVGGCNPTTSLDRMVINLLEVLDCALSLLAGGGAMQPLSAAIHQKATKTATSLLLLPTAGPVQVQARHVLATLFGSRAAYHAYKDNEVLLYVHSELQALQPLLSSDALRDVDPEAFYRLVLLVRAIATARPTSLARICQEQRYELVADMMRLVEALHRITPQPDEPTSVVQRGLCHTETIVHCLVEIMYAFALADMSQVERMTQYFIRLLKNDATVISHSAKEAIILLLSPRVKRRKPAATLSTPPACQTPTPTATNAGMTIDADAAAAAAAAAASVAAEPRVQEILEAAAAVFLPPPPAANDAERDSGAAGEFADDQAMDGHDAAVVAAAVEHRDMLNLEAFMGGNFPQLLGLQQDADDDETIMDIAIALSLQQHDSGDGMQSLRQDLANLQSMRNVGDGLPQLHDDANIGIASVNAVAPISAGGSDDDEGSNAATDGSTLRTSPAEPAGSGGSESSGGSGVESIGGASGRSSTYGDQANASPPQLTSAVTANTANPVQTKDAPATSLNVNDAESAGADNPATATHGPHTTMELEAAEANDDNIMKLHELRISILENIIANIRILDDCNGLQAIPLIQVILMLTTDLNGSIERDQKVLSDLLTTLIEYIEMDSVTNASKMKERNSLNEVRLVLLCLFGVLMGKTKSKQTGTTSPPHQFKDNASFVASTTASILSNNGAFTFALVVMESLLQHWKTISTDQSSNNGLSSSSSGSGTSVGVSNGSVGAPSAANLSNIGGATTAIVGQNNLLKPVRYGIKPDITTLIPHNYVKNYTDVFDSYDALLTEISVRLPYQILRLSATHPGTYDWYHNYCENMTYTLCEYMMLNLNALLRRQVRKLLMYICGNKEKFRMFRDGHSLDVHFNFVKDLCNLYNTKNLVLANQTIPLLSYDSLVELTEHLRTCQEISQIRTGNWQKFCLIHEDVIPVLIEIACYQLDDGVSPIILQLLQAALCNNSQAVKQQQSGGGSGSGATSKLRSDRDKSEEIELSFDSKFDAAHCSTFVHQIFRYVSDVLLNKFVRIFLLETNITSIRWQAHSLIYAIYEHSNERQKEKFIQVLWNMWSLVPVFGRRTAQFVDILGYLTLSTKSIAEKLPEYTEKAVEVLRQQNELLAKHPNAPIYTTLEQILQVNGYYLESEPCLVCNNPEVPMANIKLPSIKSDSKFTTTTMIVKLVQSHTISKLVLRIADMKRTKMVRSMNIFYNNRSVQAVVELKNRPAMWHKARSITLQSGQTEVKVDFPLPITACNLMIEYADFYETVTGSSENLQCPRCSAAVPAYPGVCANCGENVFQCHKCRAINYDEKDPFLCHSCGFCKYAKFDFSIYGRVCCAVDPIESAEDRAKTVQIIHTSLERADRIYRQLQTNKQMLELLIQKVVEHRCTDRLVDDNLGTLHSTSQVSKIIQLLAQKYCVESRTSFEELSKIVQKVKACRSELVTYDRSQQDQPNSGPVPDMRNCYAINRCYGCALASTEQCLTLLRAMAFNYNCRLGLYTQGLVEELAQNNLRRGTPAIQDEVRNLLVLLTKHNDEACMQLLELISDRVKTAILGAIPLANLDNAIHHEMLLLEVLMAQDDFCWESKLKVVFELFLLTCRAPRGPIIAVIQPCLRILQALICPTIPTSKLNRDLSPSELSTIVTVDGLTVDFGKWLSGDAQHAFDAWKMRMPINRATKTQSNVVVVSASVPDDDDIIAAVLESGGAADTLSALQLSQKQREKLSSKQRRQEERAMYLSEKYGSRWRSRVVNKEFHNVPLVLAANWLQPILFNTNSRFGRQLACSLLTSLSRTHERKREILNLLTGFLKHVGEVGESSAEFLAFYRALASDTPWRQYLALKGLLGELSHLLQAEILKIHRLEETSLSSDLSLGYALRQFVELLALFLENSNIRQAYKTRLLGTVLEGYLSLRKLVVQRTRLIDDAQEKLLEMLEEMTSGTEEETRAFMEILIDTVEKTRANDIKTPVFIFERLYSIIHPEEHDESEFFMTLEKDPQQEDFLQGRMLGNPYPSTEVGLGPLMRDVKNKICTDCELIALLEDDNGMELLVNNKIISLDLPVKEVYKKIWIAEGGERDAMRIVYRMRGLLGDATEEFVETLNNKSQEEIDTEQLYRMANVLADCKGLKVMLDRIGSLQSISRTRELIQVLLKLFLISVKVRRCQEVLCQPELGAINTLLKVLQMCLQSETDSIQSAVTEQLLEIMETILSKAASDTLDSFLQFSLTFGGPEYVSALISCTDCPNVRNNPSVLRHLIRVLAALVYGNEVKMALLCEHFKEILDFDLFDVEHTSEEEFKMELFCVLTNQIEHNCIGGTLKDYIVGLGFVKHAIEYVTVHAPCVKPTLLRTDSDELKEFISRPSLKYILRFLTGLATKHEATQVAISQDIIPIIHRLEQVSSDEHVGSLAENLLEALCTDAATATRVQEVRDFTRAEKKRLAMATREKQLDALGMRTNEKGQVTAKGSILQKIEKLRDETGLTCFICREGYACQSAKVLGIYTFTKRCNVEEFELKTRKTIGYTTVTHFNVVHVDCHTSAIRLTRGRDEWERASLQNANTRCNGLLPLWGPDVSESAFSTCMTRHSSYMQESTQRCDISFPSSVHDLKLLLMRFAWERSFHDDAGGGGPQSNMHFVPYLLFYSVYLLLSSRSAVRDSKTLLSYLTAPPSEKWLECGYEVDGPVYMVTLSLMLHSHEIWNKHKIAHLKRLIAIAHARHVSPSVLCKALLSDLDRQPANFTVYRPYMLLWALIDLIYNTVFKPIVTPKEEDWSILLFAFIRKNDEAMLKTTDAILQIFTDEFLPCTSFSEFCDVAGLLHLIENPDDFIPGIIATLPTTA